MNGTTIDVGDSPALTQLQAVPVAATDIRPANDGRIKDDLN